MELTKEYFDKGLENLTKHFNGRFDEMVTKKELESQLVLTKNEIENQFKSQTVELKQYVHEAFEVQQTWMESRFDELLENSYLQKRVDHIESVVRKIVTKVGLDYQK